jgi:hypothetical protein
MEHQKITHTMKPIFANFGTKSSVGRSPIVKLSHDDLQAIRALYLRTNHNRKEGSMLLAWVRFCESRPDLSHLVADHMPTTTIPTQVVEACRAAKPLVGPHRGDRKRLMHEAAHVPGTMRRHQDGRRLYAGERASADDATRNVACYIPWPWGGCPCSDKFGVRLGRWQTLIVHDDASGYVPVVSSVFRWKESYRAADVASLIYKTETDVLQFQNWAIEGGVWQAKQSLAVLGNRWISAKGRPNQKLVENYIGRLWRIMDGLVGDVGRHRGEMLKNSELYLKCRSGKEDPRKHFMSLDEGQRTLYQAVDYLAEKRMNSAAYGTWIPKERWAADLEQFPRTTRTDAADFLILPEIATRTVRKGAVSAPAPGPMGVPMHWTFMADWLWNYEGRRVTVYFDPLEAWPVIGTITLEGDRKPIGTVECVSPEVSSKDRATEMVKAIRATMMTELRILGTMHTTRTVRHSGGIIRSVSDPSEHPKQASPAPAVKVQDRIGLSDPWLREPLDIPSTPRETLAPAPRVTRGDLANSLSRRLSRIRGGVELSQP